MSHNSREHLPSDHMTSDHVTNGECEDVYIQLAQREHELMLAAELGKALLERNQELNCRSEQLVEEFNTKVEVLTQEKHGLKLKLETLKTEYDTTVRELQNDIRLLTEALDEKDSDSRNGNKEKSGMIEELMAQNEKMADQLRKAHETEKEIRGQLRSLHDEMDLRSHTTQDTIMCMDALNKQTSHLRQKKEELESKVRLLSEERSSLVESLDDWQDRLHEKEQLSTQQKNQICDLEKTLDELRDRNQQLQERLAPGNHGNSCLDGGSDLYSELSMSGLATAMSTESLDEPLKMGQQDWGPNQQYGMNYYGCDPSMFNDDEDIEYDDVDYTMKHLGDGGHHANSGTESPVSQKTLTSVSSRDSLEDQELRKEVLEVYKQLHHLVLDLTGQGKDWCPAALRIEDMKGGSLLSVFKELSVLVEGASLTQDSHTVSPDIQDRLDCQEEKLSRLKRQLLVAETEVDKMAEEVMFKEEQLMRRTEEVQTLAKQIKHEHKLNEAVRRERDQLLDQQVEVTHHKVIAEVRKEREAAITKKNETELELARSRLDMVHLDQQLLEAVQQKLELSQQLELWQVDMEELIDKQVTKRIKEEKHEKAKTQQNTSKRFSLFRR